MLGKRHAAVVLPCPLPGRGCASRTQGWRWQGPGQALPSSTGAVVPGASTGAVVSNQPGHRCCLLRKCHMCPAHPVGSGVPSSHLALGHHLHLHYEDTFSGKIRTEEAIGSKAQAAPHLSFCTVSCVSVLSPVAALSSAGTQMPGCVALRVLRSYPAGPASLPAPALPVPHSCDHLGSLQTMHSV